MLALGSKGNIYVASWDTIYRIDASGNVASAQFTGSDDPITSMTADPEGNLYLATSGYGDQVFKVSVQ
jgi:ligand-binding sensor domain-containing protein